MGNVPWSPELQESMNRIGYYQRCRLIYCLKRNVNSSTLKHWFTKSKAPTRITTAQEAINSLKQEFKTYNIVKNRAPEMRKLFLETLAEARAEEGGLTKETILKQMIQQENQRRTFRRIKWVLRRFRQKLTAIEVPVNDGQWEVRTSKEEIEQGCIDENVRRFSQANNTAPMQANQIELLGWKANTQYALDILQRNLPLNDELHPHIQLMANT
jgi:hypothetical protein